MNWYSVFYWLTVADNFKSFFVTGVVIFMIVCIIVTICHLIMIAERYEEGKVISRKWLWWSYPFCIVFWFLYLFTPSKGDTLLIIAGGSVGNFITSDSSSRAIPSDISRFLHLKLRSEIEDVDDEVKKQLDIQSPKDKLIDKVKTLTKEEIIEYLRKDSIISK